VSKSHLLFLAGEHALAAPADVVQAVHDSLDVQRVAGTKSWFKGLAVANGKLLPVTDLCEFLGQRSASGHTIELSESVGIAGLKVDDVFGLSDKTADRRSADEGVPANMAVTPWVISDAGREYRVIDIEAMLVRPEFIDIAESSGS